MTDRVDSVIVSLLLRCKLRERLRFIDTCPPREQVHIFVVDEEKKSPVKAGNDSFGK